MGNAWINQMNNVVGITYPTVMDSSRKPVPVATEGSVVASFMQHAGIKSMWDFWKYYAWIKYTSDNRYEGEYVKFSKDISNVPLRADTVLFAQRGDCEDYMRLHAVSAKILGLDYYGGVIMFTKSSGHAFSIIRDTDGRWYVLNYTDYIPISKPEEAFSYILYLYDYEKPLPGSDSVALLTFSQMGTEYMWSGERDLDASVIVRKKPEKVISYESDALALRRKLMETNQLENLEKILLGLVGGIALAVVIERV